MIDKKKVILAAIVASLVIGGLIAAVVILAFEGRSRTPVQPAPAPSSARMSPTPQGQTMPDAPQWAYTRALQAAGVAAAAENFDTPEVFAQRCRQFSFSEELVNNYKPVWRRIFHTGDYHSFFEAAKEPVGIDKVEGKEGHRKFRFGVSGVVNTVWGQQEGGRFVQYSNYSPELTWWVTIDEATRQVVALEDPGPELMGITPSPRANPSSTR